MKSANHSDATIDDILLAADSLAELGEEYFDDAMELFLRVSDHPDVIPEQIEKALDNASLCVQGEKYTTEVRYIATKLLNHRNSTDGYKEHAEKYLEN